MGALKLESLREFCILDEKKPSAFPTTPILRPMLFGNVYPNLTKIFVYGIDLECLKAIVENGSQITSLSACSLDTRQAITTEYRTALSSLAKLGLILLPNSPKCSPLFDLFPKLQA